MGGDPGDVHAAAAMLNHQQDVEAAQKDRVDVVSRPVYLPVLARLWRPRHTGKIAHARELAELIAARYPDRTVHVVGTALTWENVCATWTTRSPGPAGSR